MFMGQSSMFRLSKKLSSWTLRSTIHTWQEKTCKFLVYNNKCIYFGTSNK